MDLWDVVKIMVRRWYLAGPLVLLTIAALAWTGTAVSPNHTSHGHVMLLPPSAEVESAAGEQRTVNPWSTESLTGLVVTHLRNQGLHRQLQAEGYRGTWEVGPDTQFRSVIAISVTASTAEQAQATLLRLLDIVDREVSARQGPYDLPETMQITSARLDQGENLETRRGNQARALIVVAGIGGIITIGLTVGVDALLRALDRRRRRAEASQPVHAVEPVAGVAAARDTTTINNGSRHFAQTPAQAGYPPGDTSVRTGIGVRYLSPSSPPNPPASSPPETSASGRAPAPDEPDDSTIVLPLSNARAFEHDDDGKPSGGWRD